MTGPTSSSSIGDVGAASAVRPLSVLVADDDDDHAFMIESALSKVPAVRMTRVRDGRAVVEELVHGAGAVDLVLLDLKMPGMGGMDALLAMPPRTAGRPPVVVLTTSSSPEDREAARQAGADDYLVKPMRLAEFRATVESVCTRCRADGFSPRA